jgi:predicted HTH transcriptional regulator
LRNYQHTNLRDDFNLHGYNCDESASDCRNRTLQRMFLMIGLGERAGSGMAKIQRGWAQTGGALRLIDSGKSESAIVRAIHKLKVEGRLTCVGANKGGRWVVTDHDELP